MAASAWRCGREDAVAAARRIAALGGGGEGACAVDSAPAWSPARSIKDAALIQTCGSSPPAPSAARADAAARVLSPLASHASPMASSAFALSPALSVRVDQRLRLGGTADVGQHARDRAPVPRLRRRVRLQPIEARRPSAAASSPAHWARSAKVASNSAGNLASALAWSRGGARAPRAHRHRRGRPWMDRTHGAQQDALFVGRRFSNSRQRRLAGGGIGEGIGGAMSFPLATAKPAAGSAGRVHAWSAPRHAPQPRAARQDRCRCPRAGSSPSGSTSSKAAMSLSEEHRVKIGQNTAQRPYLVRELRGALHVAALDQIIHPLGPRQSAGPFDRLAHDTESDGSAAFRHPA